MSAAHKAATAQLSDNDVRILDTMDRAFHETILQFVQALQFNAALRHRTTTPTICETLAELDGAQDFLRDLIRAQPPLAEVSALKLFPFKRALGILDTLATQDLEPDFLLATKREVEA